MFEMKVTHYPVVKGFFFRDRCGMMSQSTSVEGFCMCGEYPRVMQLAQIR